MNEYITVHVVDDDDSVCNALSRLLKAAGFQSRTYASAQELLAGPVGKDDGNDVVLTDLCMPDVDGMALAKKLSTTPFPPPVVFLSAQADVTSSVVAMKESPVIFPPGRARLAISPRPIGSGTETMTIGMVVVACLTATICGLAATMTSSWIRTISAARSGLPIR